MPFLLVQAQPNSERKAALWLERAGVESYVPMTSIDDRPPKPFFPRYLFARDVSDVDPISLQYLYGVSGLVKNGAGSFARVGDDVIEALRDREEDGVIRFFTPQPDPLRKHENVALNVGGVDLAAVFLRMKGEDRAQVLVSLFGRTSAQIVHLHNIRRMI